MEASISATLWEQAQTTNRPLTLDVRGTLFTLDRTTLVDLPENILFCLFPQGLLPLAEEELAGAAGTAAAAAASAETAADQEQETYYSDFDPACLSYLLAFFQSARDDFYGTATCPGRYQPAGAEPDTPLSRLYPNPFYNANGENPLLTRQAVIVLREELEYYPIPAQSTLPRTKVPPLEPIDFSRSTAQEELAALTEAYEPNPAEECTNLVSGAPTSKLLELKEKAGQALLQRQHIFTALQRNVNKENNVAEQHLIDMLCMSGFDRSDTWGFRALEPSRCSMVSLALVLLKTGTVHAGEAEAIAAIDARQQATAQTTDGTAPHDANQQWDRQYSVGPEGSRIDQAQLATAQKLLLFWRKPARKCWWDGVDVMIPFGTGDTPDPPPTANAWDHAIPALASGQDKSGPGARQGSDTVPGSDPASTAGMTQAEVELWKSGQGRRVRVWARRIWTLELSLL